MLEPIRLTSLANEAFDRVVAAITSGEFEPGEKLSESRLARELGVSRGPIREALQRLEGKLVQRVPHIGVQVIEFGADELMQLFYLREALEGMAARLAAEKADKAWAVAAERMLEQHAAELRDSGGRSYRQRAVDNDFHFSIAKASGCANIERLLLNEVNYQLRIARLKSSMRPGRAEEALKQHYEIFEAIAGGDPDRAEAAMRNHISSARVGSMASLTTGEAPSKAEAG
ncbi:GntR family transcriptional regulator [Aliihoeflea aestuarii]|jgi:DNA-binding GntR family transcriptional regulator|uniref:GntR family transcriptional regulator n=1 Tax=Aliihoeflea aestuarii TaxID=453840 RepID=UPI002092F6F3|nr:GntR family transcriptional regulator [Aliihoeflea aestuarii]